MDLPRSSSRHLLSNTILRRPRAQLALALALAIAPILSLLGVTGTTLAAGTSTVTITPAVGGNISEGAGTASFLVSLSDPIADGAVTVAVSTHDGTGANGAVAPGDYTTLTSQLVTFTPARQTPATVTVTINQDTVDELNEAFTIDVAVQTNTSSTTITASSAITAIIQDDDSPSLLAISAVPPEVNESDISASIIATLSASSPQPVTLNWHLIGSGASPATLPPSTPADVTVASGVWVIPAGSTTQAFLIGVVDDALAEDDEQFQVIIDTVANLTNATPIQGPVVTITDHNTPPVAVNDTPLSTPPVPAVLEDSAATTINVLANDTDVDGGTKRVVSVTQPTNGTVAIVGIGTGVSYQPKANYCNNGTPTDNFTYTLNGGSTATVSVPVTCVNDPPVVDANGATAGIDGTATFTEGGLNTPITTANLTVTDLESNAITSAVVTITDLANGAAELLTVTPSGGITANYNPVAGTLTLTSAAAVPLANLQTVLRTLTYSNSSTNPGTSRTISIVATDNGTPAETSSPATKIVIAITIIDGPPVAVADPATVLEDSGATTIDVLNNDTDADGGLKRVFSVTQPTNGTVAITGVGTDLTYEPNANYCNNGVPTDNFTYTLTPGTSSTTVSVTVTCVNDAPIIDANGATAGIDGTAAFTEGGTNTPITTASLTVSDQESNAITSAVVKITDLANGSAELLAVTPSGGITANYNPVAGTLTLTSAAAVPLANLQTVLRTLTYSNSAQNPGGSRTISIVATDNGGATSSPATLIVIAITTVDNPPTVANNGLTVNEGDRGNITDLQLKASDPDTAPANLTFTIASTTTKGRLLRNGIPATILSNGSSFTQADIDAGLMSYTHNGTDTTSDSFTFSLKDATSTVSGQIFKIAINPVNDAPVINLSVGPTTYQIGSAPVAVDATATITDSDSLNFNGGRINVALTGGGPGDTLSVRNNGSGAGQIGTLGPGIYFSGILIGTVSTSTSTSLVITLNASATPTAAQALVRNIVFSNTAPSTTPGSRVATFTVNDGLLLSLPKSRTITFNQPPVAVDDTVIIPMNGIAEPIAVLSNDSDADNDTITITAITQGAHGTVAVGVADANVTYTPAAAYLGPDSFTYTISDGHGGSDTATINVTVKKTTLYLPVVMKPAYADLAVSFTVTPAAPVAGQSTNIAVTVTNRGDGPASNFWIDFYVDPTAVPQVNDRWNDLCRPDGYPCYGMAWYYAGTLAPGQSVVLNSSEQSAGNPNGYRFDASTWPGYFYNGVTKLYVIVDSWNRDASGTIRDPQGAVHEIDESNNRAAQDITVEFGLLPRHARLNDINSLSARN